MCTSYYQFDLDPFRLTPDPRFAYPHRGFRDARTNMQLAREQWDGILVVTGRPGTGKTTLCEAFLLECKTDDMPANVVVASQLQRGEFLYMVARAIGIDDSGSDKANGLEQIEAFLLARPPSVLIVDEAQNLSEPALQEVLALSHLDRDSQPLLLIFLVGQENLTDNLRSPAQEQLRQRITRTNHLGALGLEETCAYILHRLGCAGWVGNPSISAEALVLIHRFSLGLPRHICKLSSRLLTHGTVKGQVRLDRRSVAGIVAELQEEMLLPQCDSIAFFDVQGLHSSPRAALGDIVALTSEEREFLAGNPKEMTAAPGMTRVSEAPVLALTAPAATVATPPSVASELAARQGNGWRQSARHYYCYGALILAIAAGGAYLGAARSVKPTGNETVEVMVQANGPVGSPLAEVAVDLAGVSVVNPGHAHSTLGAQLDVLAVDFEPVPAAADTSLHQVEADALLVTSGAVARTVPQPGAATVGVGRKTTELLWLGERALANNYLTTPGELCAYHYFSQVLELDPNSEAGSRGLQAIAERYGLMATSMMEKERYRIAGVFIQRGLAVVEKYPQLLALQAELESRLASRQEEPANGETELAKPAKKGLVGVLQRFFRGKGNYRAVG
jgi:type II secretory pathway predicted ATPase ExeA